MRGIDRRVVAIVAGAISLTACAVTPSAPTIPVTPGANKSFDAFAADQSACQQYAAAQIAQVANAANNQAVGGAILTTALGAALGGAIGGGQGAGIGAASGAALGTVAGASGSGYAQTSLQQQYDLMYAQCMTAHGNSVPSFAPPTGPPPYGAPGQSPYAGPSGASPYAQGGYPGSYQGGYQGAYPGAPVPPPPSY